MGDLRARRLWILAMVMAGTVGCGGGDITSPADKEDRVEDAGAPPDASGDLPPSDFPPDSSEVPLLPNGESSSGVEVDDDGNLVIDPDVPSVLLSYIWIANSSEGTVSKIDTETGVEVARYRSGPGTYPDPSRTTVGLDGDVVVANRSGSSAVRIRADSAACPDVNSDGVIETSSGPGDVLPWGEDECVLWYTEFPQYSIARGAAYAFDLDPDGILYPSVWIGLYSGQKLVKLDIETGAILAEVDITGHMPYGLAFDGHGVLWAFSASTYELIRLDTRTLEWEAIAIPDYCAYGITVDEQRRVWTSGQTCVGRYTYDTATWDTMHVGGFNRGLAVDGAGSVWVADTSFGVHRVDEETLAHLGDVPLGYGGFVGMAADFRGKVWAVAQSESKAYRIDPDTMNAESFPTGSHPYTYSDMTGFQLQNAAPPLGVYRVVVEGCGPETQWHELYWQAETPVGTFVHFQARAAETADALGSAPFAFVARQPDGDSPADLQEALEVAQPGGSFGAYLELEITLGSASAELTPVLSSVAVTSSCAPHVD